MSLVFAKRIRLVSNMSLIFFVFPAKHIPHKTPPFSTTGETRKTGSIDNEFDKSAAEDEQSKVRPVY